MKKIVRLTEKDLNRIVRRVINEQRIEKTHLTPPHSLTREEDVNFCSECVIPYENCQCPHCGEYDESCDDEINNSNVNKKPFSHPSKERILRPYKKS